MDPDMDLHCLSKRLQILQQTTKAFVFFVICALRANKCEFSVYTVRIFMKCKHVTTYFSLSRERYIQTSMRVSSKSLDYLPIFFSNSMVDRKVDS